MQRRDDLLMRLLGEAMRRLGPDEAEQMAALVGEEYGRSLASRMTPPRGSAPCGRPCTSSPTR